MFTRLARLAGSICAFAALAHSADIRSASAKAVAMIQLSQKNWNQDCYSCHQHLLPAMAFDAARRHGIPLDEEAARAAAVHAFARLADLDRTIQFTYLIDPAVSEAYLLEGAAAAGVRPSITTALYARIIANRQRPDGHWDTDDVRPPQSYSPVTATANALRAIRLYAHPSLAADTAARAERARRWLESTRPRDTEERTMQLLGLVWAGAPKSSIAPVARALFADQQADGGWRAVPTRPSDAYSTAEALVALHEAAGMPTSDPGWKRGIDFLLRTQVADGSWHVVSRVQPPAPVSPPYFETGYPYGHDQFISAMGAAWAVRALADALGDEITAPAAHLREAAPSAVEPWMETVAFGSAADVRALLAKGFDPNSATRGGTTALMLAMPDLEKAKLLLHSGARINARARTRFSALMVAAQYSGSEPVLRFLLERGAQVSMPKGAGAPIFNSNALTLAAISGNDGLIPALLHGGDRVDSPMMMLGLFPETPLLAAVFNGDLVAARLLLDGGAAADRPDADGITALGWAAIANQAAIAQLLIARGADVNHVDKKGMTPLLYAASTGFGDSAVIAALLKGGADPRARSKEGFTAADLVRRYKHTQLYSSLSAAN